MKSEQGNLEPLLRDQKFLVCVGSGGVGKTTTTAVLGLCGAMIGKRTLIITIDPARRLADALGMQPFKHTPQKIDPKLLHLSGIPVTADVSAMMLDLQDAWDDLVLRLTGDQATATRILGNRFYQQLSRELPGAQEFIACESLYTLAESAEYDLIVLDTPPTQNALDFLNAPDRILGFLKTDGFQNFLTQKNGWVNRAGLQFLDVAGLAVQRLLAHFTGGAFLEELSEFMVLMKDLYQPISERTEGFKDILASKDSSFFIVTAPHPTSLNECQFFAEELHRRNFPVSAVIGNQLIPPTKLENIQRVPESLRFHLSRLPFREGEIDVLIPALLQSEIEQHSQWKTEQHHFNELRETLGQELRFFAVPDFVDNPHNIEGLARMVPYFMGPAAQRVPK